MNRGANRGTEPSLHLQRALGNQAVQRLLDANSEGLKADYGTSATNRVAHDFGGIPIYARTPMGIQTKLKVNTPGDIYEQEADRVANQVMNIPEQSLQRACQCDGECPQCKAEHPAKGHGGVQRKEVQPTDVHETSAPPIVYEVLDSPGQPLNQASRAFFEPRFVHDFGSVQVHADARAAESARAVHALAYTVGSDIVFGAGQYMPGTSEGDRLLAHELTHVVQQTAVVSRRFQRISVSVSAKRELMRDRRHTKSSHPSTPTLGGCRPVQDDLRPTAPWADLQRGYRARCASAAADVAGQVEHTFTDILHGRMPRAPHLPDPRSSVDCACALGTPREAALAALPVLVAAGPLAVRLYLHFLDASGTPVTIDVDDMIRRSAGVRHKIRRSIAHGGMTGTTRLEQSDYRDRELQFAYGAIDCVQWQALAPGRSWRSDPTTQVRISMLDYYEFHPGRHGVSQCAHAACVESVARGEAKNFWTNGEAVVTWSQLQH